MIFIFFQNASIFSHKLSIRDVLHKCEMFATVDCAFQLFHFRISMISIAEQKHKNTHLCSSASKSCIHVHYYVINILYFFQSEIYIAYPACPRLVMRAGVRARPWCTRLSLDFALGPCNSRRGQPAYTAPAQMRRGLLLTNLRKMSVKHFNIF